MKILTATAAILAVAFAASPASAKMMACSGDNMAKSVAAGATMADGPAKMAMMKEVGMANTQMSKGDMRGACKSYARAQRAGMMKNTM
ncbi:MAG: hypothetical protein JWP21_3192 [Tardiphaga sp.]|jgi:hypothetical protein|nr:hypothetical protein [Tardiphaga sp.]MDB5549745.1 hypothetical protein [Tardiphaga sp.]